MRRVVFHHIPKCGGTTVFEVLQPHYQGGICPIRSKQLPLLKGKLDKYDLFSGHYSPVMVRTLPSNFISPLFSNFPRRLTRVTLTKKIVEICNYITAG